MPKTECLYKEHAHALGELHIGSQVAIQHPRSKLWDTYDTINAVGHYFVKPLSEQKKTHPFKVLDRSWSSLKSDYILLHLSSA